MFGLELVKGSNGLLGRGTIYIMLADMEDEGLVCAEPEPRIPGYEGNLRKLWRLPEREDGNQK